MPLYMTNADVSSREELIATLAPILYSRKRLEQLENTNEILDLCMRKRQPWFALIHRKHFVLALLDSHETESLHQLNRVLAANGF